MKDSQSKVVSYQRASLLAKPKSVESIDSSLHQAQLGTYLCPEYDESLVYANLIANI